MFTSVVLLPWSLGDHAIHILRDIVAKYDDDKKLPETEGGGGGVRVDEYDEYNFSCFS